jgi:hypothetical protein
VDRQFTLQHTALQLQLCELQAHASRQQTTAGSHGSRSPQAVLPLQLVGFSCSSSHDLSREFVAADPEEQQTGAGTRKGASRPKGGRGTQEEEVGYAGDAMLACLGSILLIAGTGHTLPTPWQGMPRDFCRTLIRILWQPGGDCQHLAELVRCWPCW